MSVDEFLTRLKESLDVAHQTHTASLSWDSQTDTALSGVRQVITDFEKGRSDG